MFMEQDSWEEAEKQAYAFTTTTTTVIPVDRGPKVSPRYGIMTAPEIGSKVSRAFNGDYYPAGEITRISDSFRRIETSDGTVFWRKGRSDIWRQSPFCMVAGHIERLNPSF